MNLGIIGVGGVGGYFGGKLARLAENTPDMNVYFVARNTHLEAIKKDGLLIESEEETYIVHPILATDNVLALPVLDLCIICVKGYDLKDVMISLKDKISEQTIILPLLNGVDVVERIKEVVQVGTVLPACVYVGTHIERPGKIKQKGGACTIHYGDVPSASLNVAVLFDHAGIKYNYYDNPYKEIWGKFIFVAAYSLVCAAHDMSLGAVKADPVYGAQVKDIMKEMSEIARKTGVMLDPDIVKLSFDKGSNFPYEAKTSFHRDYKHPHKKDERDIFGGSIIRIGKEYRVATPVTQTIYDMLR